MSNRAPLHSSILEISEMSLAFTSNGVRKGGWNSFSATNLLLLFSQYLHYEFPVTLILSVRSARLRRSILRQLAPLNQQGNHHTAHTIFFLKSAPLSTILPGMAMALQTSILVAPGPLREMSGRTRSLESHPHALFASALTSSSRFTVLRIHCPK